MINPIRIFFLLLMALIFTAGHRPSHGDEVPLEKLSIGRVEARSLLGKMKFIYINRDESSPFIIQVSKDEGSVCKNFAPERDRRSSRAEYIFFVIDYGEDPDIGVFCLKTYISINNFKVEKVDDEASEVGVSAILKLNGRRAGRKINQFEDIQLKINPWRFYDWSVSAPAK